MHRLGSSQTAILSQDGDWLSKAPTGVYELPRALNLTGRGDRPMLEVLGDSRLEIHHTEINIAA